MRNFIVAAALVAAGSCFASQSVHQGNDWIRVWDSACVSAETLARIPPQLRDKFHKVQGYIGGEKFFGCWQEMGESIYIIWDDGDKGSVPKSMLKDDPEA